VKKKLGLDQFLCVENQKLRTFGSIMTKFYSLKALSKR